MSGESSTELRSPLGCVFLSRRTSSSQSRGATCRAEGCLASEVCGTASRRSLHLPIRNPGRHDGSRWIRRCRLLERRRGTREDKNDECDDRRERATAMARGKTHSCDANTELASHPGQRSLDYLEGCTARLAGAAGTDRHSKRGSPGIKLPIGNWLTCQIRPWASGVPSVSAVSPSARSACESVNDACTRCAASDYAERERQCRRLVL